MVYQNSSEDIKQAHAAAIEMYIQDHVGMKRDGTFGDLYFNELLNDWSKFDINKRTKFDATISSGLAIMANNRHLYAPNAKVEKPKLNIRVSKYTNTGKQFTNNKINMAYSGVKSYFPSQTVSDAEKLSYEYGLKVGKAIEQEWFNEDRNHNRYRSNNSDFHNLRLYARGEQSIQKYKDELSINGDLSYLNLDWKPIPIISKFVDIVVNGMTERLYDIKAYSQDPYGVSKRTAYMESILADMRTKDLNAYTEEAFGIQITENEPETLPDSEEELQLHMQLTYKQAVEIAEEQAINTLLDGNKYELIKKRFLL